MPALEPAEAAGVPEVAFDDLPLTEQELADPGLASADTQNGLPEADAAGSVIEAAEFAAAAAAEDDATFSGNEQPGADPVTDDADTGADESHAAGAALDEAGSTAEPDSAEPDSADPGSADPGSAGFLDHALVERPPLPVIQIGLLASTGRLAADDDARAGAAWTDSLAPGNIAPGGAPAGGAAGSAADRRRALRERVAAGHDVRQLADSGAGLLATISRAGLAWARRRELGPTSLAGISLALAVCAAAWFSAGTTTGMIRGAIAFGIGYLVLVTGRKLSPSPAPGLRLAAPQTLHGEVRDDARKRPAGPATRSGVPRSGGPWADGPWSDRPWSDGPRSGRPWSGVRRSAAQRSRANASRARGGGSWPGTLWLSDPARTAPWLAAVAACLAECVAYAGLAIGAVAAGWTRMWPLAVGVAGLVAVRNLMSACSNPPGFGDQPGVVRRIAAAALTMPLGGRILLVGIVAPVWGARTALLALLDWAIISIGFGIAGRTAAAAAGERDEPDSSSQLLRLRDDGVLARGLGMLVRGSLVPLPPAILGIAAVAALALVGLHGLPGALMIAPAIVMLLAAPGSAHAHTGRLDWLVPVLLLGAQVLYLGAIGLARGVPGPVVYILIAALLLRYADLAFPGRPVMLAGEREPGQDRAERGSALGWDGRVLIAGLAAAMGIATFAYVALAAYLGVLICVKAMASSLALQEDAPRDRPGYGSRRRTPPAS